MMTFKFTIQSPLGVHAKPALTLVEETKKLTSSIFIQFHDKKKNAKDIMSILALNLKKDDVITFVIEGIHEVRDAQCLQQFCKTNL